MAEKAVIILGIGGHAKVLLDILLICGIKVLGFLDKDISVQNQTIFGIPVLGTDEDICRYGQEEIELVNGIGSVGVATLRRNVFERFKSQGYHFRQVIHPNAIISAQATLGEGVQVMAGAVINIGTCVEDDAIINTRASVDHDCHIGQHVHIAPGCVLSGGVFVGERTLIGTGSSVIQGIRIGRDSVIGAGSLVIHDMPREIKAFGVPANIQR